MEPPASPQHPSPPPQPASREGLVEGNLRARVFVSCGQRNKTDEIAIADAIGARLIELGYEPYIAVREQRLHGLAEAIFEQLGHSEYFLFVDFRREQLLDPARPDEVIGHRGSLFCHQELAIASYLHIDVLAYQEEGVRRQEGLLGFLQGNPISFTDRSSLPDRIAAEVQRRNWNPCWRNVLTLGRNPDTFANEQDIHGQWRRFFQVMVCNNHRHRLAVNCYAYLESVYDVGTQRSIAIEAAEHKWHGCLIANPAIPAANSRRFDSFYVPYNNPREIHFNILTDYRGMRPQLQGKGPFDLRYMVLSENFPITRGSFRLTPADRLEQIRLDPLET
jgi:hypothetical protein